MRKYIALIKFMTYNGVEAKEYGTPPTLMLKGGGSMKDHIGVANMDRETYEQFAKGLRRAIAEAGYKLGEFADGIMNPVTLSNNLKEHNPTMMVESNRFACAKKLRMDVHEIVQLGRGMSINGDHNVQTVAGRDVRNGSERRKMTPQEEYFWSLLNSSDHKEKLLKQFIDILHKEG